MSDLEDEGKTDSHVPTLAEGDQEELMVTFRRVEGLDIGSDHPSLLAESATLHATDTPSISAELQKELLSSKYVDPGKISNVQMQAVLLCKQSWQQFLPNGERKGFFLGDGTGLGKGRSCACLILDAYSQGHKRSVWISVNKELFNDAKRDMLDVSGVGKDGKNGRFCPRILNLAQFNSSKLDSVKNKKDFEWDGDGVIYATYTLLAKKSGTSPLVAKYRTPMFLSLHDWNNTKPTTSFITPAMMERM